MSSSRLTRAALLLCAAGLVPAAAQENLNQRYQRAVAAFNNAEWEDACQIFQDIEKEKPGFQDTRNYMQPACAEVKRVYDAEEKLFTQGMDLFRQNRWDEAQQKLQQALRVPLKNPKYAEEIKRALAAVEARQNEPRLFQEGVALFNDKKYAAARERFQAVAQAGGDKAAEARSYLERIDRAAAAPAPKPEALAPTPSAPPAAAPVVSARQLLADTRAALDNKDLATAREKLKAAETLGPPSAELKKLQQQLNDAESQAGLRAALAAYFAGDYAKAEDLLTKSIEQSARHRALATFFRGAARGARFYLSGEKEGQLKTAALADFRAVQKASPRFAPPEKYVSPKILALFREAAKLEPAGARPGG
jgi:tetratricopeptide (TPR) repeat protein